MENKPDRPPGPEARLVRSLRRLPPRVWRSEVAEMLVSHSELASRVGEMAALIERDFAGRELVLVAVLRGAVVFAADLARRLSLPLRLEFLSASSYQNGVAPGEFRLSAPCPFDVRGRDVLLVDDIADSGQTLDRVSAELRAGQPRTIRTCVLLEKTPSRIRATVPDYTGFRIPDAFVVGYGLDFAGRYRNLPFIGVLHPPLCETAPQPDQAGSAAKAPAATGKNG